MAPTSALTETTRGPINIGTVDPGSLSNSSPAENLAPTSALTETTREPINIGTVDPGSLSNSSPAVNLLLTPALSETTRGLVNVRTVDPGSLSISSPAANLVPTSALTETTRGPNNIGTVDPGSLSNSSPAVNLDGKTFGGSDTGERNESPVGGVTSNPDTNATSYSTITAVITSTPGVDTIEDIGLAVGGDAGDDEVPHVDGACSPQQQLPNQANVVGQRVNYLCVCNDGFLSSPCDSADGLPTQPADFVNPNGFMVAGALINNSFTKDNSTATRKRRQSDNSSTFGAFSRNLRAEDFADANKRVGDTHFETTFGIVASWIDVGDLVNDPSNTNTFQVFVSKYRYRRNANSLATNKQLR